MIAISRENFLANATAWQSSHPTETGYAYETLQGDRIDIGWRPVPTTQQVTLDVDLGASMPVDMVGIFGAVAVGGMTQVQVRIFPAWPPSGVGTAFGTAPLDSRGDGAIVRTGVLTTRAVRFTFVASSPIHVGGLWVGRRTAIARNVARMRVERIHPAIRNELETGTEAVYQLAAVRHVLQLEWGRLREEELAQLLTVVDDTRGGVRPLMVVPDPDRTSARPYVIHGRLSARATWQVDHPEYRGIGMEIRESGRAAHVW